MGQNLEAFFNLTRFTVPDEKPYIDVFISFNARTVTYAEGNANIESTILIKNGEHIIDFRKTKIESPEFNEDSVPIDFIDVQRFPLKNGKYSIDILLRDLNVEDADTIKISYPFELFFSGHQVEISDIELVDRLEKSDVENLYSKAGYQVIPFVSDYYNTSRNEIVFYAEVYNSNNKFGSDSKYLVVSQITDTGGEVVGSYRKMSRQESSDVSVVLNKFDISELYSGTYQLQIEVRDQENKLIKSNAFQFFRNNPIPLSEVVNSEAFIEGELLFTEMIPDREILMEYIRSMWPRADQLERNIIDKQTSSASTSELQQFMYTFWFKRAPENPQEAWDQYNDMVKIVNNLYSTQLRKGYETDRGRVFLQYGKPNKLVDVPSEPSAYPYQIWQYYRIDRFSNVKFVFYSKDFSTNDYVLLHSDMRGEIYYRRWDAELHSRTTAMDNIDQNNADDHVGGHAKDYYDNPR
jgi:GWxTD domain-containing protein